MIGKTLGHYRVGEQLGRGGMGEVYLADDLNLNRKVALKFLPEAFTGDPERMARFEREAKLLASLNHPNIAAIYGLEQAEGKRFLVLELVEGETLAQRLSKGPLSVEEALGMCRQIAEGLEAAHEKGVIHRDLKPANVMITEGDKVKILDFGLAKALSDETQSIDSSQSPTLTEAMTRPGVILGTAAYMSPEQAKSKAVDKRADIWAFGCILYECLTGKRAFEGETVTETLASVLKNEPDWQALPVTIPSNIRFVLRRCLEKEIRRRFRDAADVRIEMEEALAAHPAPIVPARRFSPRLSWSIAAFLFVAATVLAWLYFNRAPAELMPTRLSVQTPEGATLVSGSGAAPWPTISPDGRRIVFGAIGDDNRQLLWIRSLDSSSAQPMPGTDGAEQPFWSPDGRFVAFFAQGKLKKIDISGGTPVTLCDAEGFTREGSWSREGVILFSIAGKTLFRVPAAGGRPTAAMAFDEARKENSQHYPSFLPDGRRFLYVAESADASKGGLIVGTLDSNERKFVRAGNSKTRYAPPGFLLFVRDGALVAQAFDARRLQLSGDPVPIAEQIRYTASSGIAAFSVSETGALTFVTRESNPRSQMIWVDRAGKQLSVLGDPDWYGNDVELSPDGKRAAVAVADQSGKTSDIWLYDVTSGLRTRFTFDPANEWTPIWSADGTRIVFNSNRKGHFDLYQKPSSGAGAEEVLVENGFEKHPSSWSPDGRHLLYAEQSQGFDLWVLPLSGERKAFPFIKSPFIELYGRYSPDGRWIAYNSNESGRDEVYVAPFPASVGKWQVSKAGGAFPRWRDDGREIFYFSMDNKLMAAAVNGTASSFEVGNVKQLFEARAVQGYAVSHDGQRFLIISALGQTASPGPVQVILNWTSLLKK
jgi:serine/threonine protein kinase